MRNVHLGSARGSMGPPARWALVFLRLCDDRAHFGGVSPETSSGPAYDERQPTNQPTYGGDLLRAYLSNVRSA